MPFLGVQPSRGLVGTAGIDDDAIDSQHYAAGSIDTAHIATNQVDGTLTKDALIADYSDVTITAADLLMYGDATDSNNTKRDTVQGILDLAGGGAWNLIGTDVGDSGGNLEVTGLSATYDTYAIALSDVVGVSDAQHGYFRLGDSGGYDSGSSDYSFIAQGTIASSGSYTGDTANANQAQMKLTMVSAQSIGNATGEGIGGLFYLHTPSDGSTLPLLSGTVSYTGNGGVLGTVAFGGRRESSITVDRVTFLFASGNVATGRMTVWGIAHA